MALDAAGTSSSPTPRQRDPPRRPRGGAAASSARARRPAVSSSMRSDASSAGTPAGVIRARRHSRSWILRPARSPHSLPTPKSGRTARWQWSSPPVRTISTTTATGSSISPIPAARTLRSPHENPQCDNDRDDDGDGTVDLDDPDCASPAGTEIACGLGAELALVLAGATAVAQTDSFDALSDRARALGVYETVRLVYDQRPDGPHLHPRSRRPSAPRRAPGSRRTCRDAAALGRHRARASPRTSTGSARSSTAAGRWCRGRTSTAGAARTCGVADLRGGVLPRRRAAAGHPERHLPARPDDLRVRHAGAAGALPAADGASARRSGPGLVGAERGQRPRGDPERPRAATATTACCNGQKTWTTRGAFADLFGLFRTDPDAERHHGLTFFLVPLDAPGRHACAASRGSTARGLRRGVLRRRVRAATRTGSASEGTGLERRDGDDRLRARPHAAQPGRFLATAQRLRRRSTARTRATRDPALARRGRARLDRRRGLPLETFRTVTRLLAGGRSAPRRASTRSSGPSSTCACTRPRCASSGTRAELLRGAAPRDGVGDWMEGFQFALAGPIYAGTNEIQRNVIAERVLGLPRE